MAVMEFISENNQEDVYGFDLSHDISTQTPTAAVDPSDDDFDDADLDDDDDLNTDDEHMAIDEEGVEVDPDDQV
jgi:hypothetical protein